MYDITTSNLKHSNCRSPPKAFEIQSHTKPHQAFDVGDTSSSRLQQGLTALLNQFQKEDILETNKQGETTHQRDICQTVTPMWRRMEI